MEPMSREELAALPTTTTIETAARALGLGRTRAYQLARENRFPCKVIRIGTSYRVVTADLQRLMACNEGS
jgi:excisionase family DNA binding protein